MNPPYRRAVLGGILALALVGVIPGTVFAAAPACGDTLMANTTLHANLDCSAYSGTALTLGAAGITLNLNGYTITGWTGDDSYYGVYVNDFNNTTITNGTIADFGFGIYTDYANGTKMTWLTIDGSGADVDDYGIYTDYAVGNKINHNSILAQEVGMYLDYGASNVINRNDVTGVDEAIYLYYENLDSLSHNKTHDADYGFYDYYGGGNTYLYNTANGHGTDGFYMYCDDYGQVRLIGNIASHNGSDGFYTEDCYIDPPGAPRYSLVKGNTANWNGLNGFEDYYSVGATFTGNTAKHNTNDGFYFDYPGDIRIIYNVSRANGDTGIELADNYGIGYGVPKSIRYNTIKGNDYGVYASYAVPNGVCVGNLIANNTTANTTAVICN